MLQPFSRRTFCTALITSFFCLVVATGEVQAKQTGSAQGSHSDKGNSRQKTALTPTEAAARAKSEHGGKVLKVTPKGKGYKVKLLTESGRVLTVTIKD